MNSHDNAVGGEPPAPGSPELTLLLNQAQQGDACAADRLLEVVYGQLRSTAGRYFRSQGTDHTLQPTALVHEAYLKLVGNPDKHWDGRGHFCAVAATAMRHILHDHARAKRTEKRGGDLERTLLTQIETPSQAGTVDMLALDEALTALAQIDERGSRLVELRYFGGLTNDQIAVELGISESTVERTWRRCRAWIKAQLDGDHAADVEGLA